MSDAIFVCADENESLKRAFAALAFFTETKGLHRSLEIAADLNSIAKVSTLEHAIELKPSANSNAYKEYLVKLAESCTEEDVSHPEQIEEAALRYNDMCHPYALCMCKAHAMSHASQQDLDCPQGLFHSEQGQCCHIFLPTGDDGGKERDICEYSADSDDINAQACGKCLPGACDSPHNGDEDWRCCSREVEPVPSKHCLPPLPCAHS